MYACIRIRGLKDVRHDITRALTYLQLDRKNHCVLMHENNESEGMTGKVKDYIAYGKISPETLGVLLQKRARLVGDKKIDEKMLKEKGFSSFAELGKSIESGKISLKSMGIKPVFRLNAPKGGFARAGIKKPVSQRGVLGFHVQGVDGLIKAMM